MIPSEEDSLASGSTAVVLAGVALAGAEAEAPEVETIGAGAVMTMAGPAEEVAAAADFSTEVLGAAGVAASADVFDLVFFMVESAVAAFCSSFFYGPIVQKMRRNK